MEEQTNILLQLDRSELLKSKIYAYLASTCQLSQKKKTQRRNTVIFWEIHFIAKGQQIRFIPVSELRYAWSEISEADHLAYHSSVKVVNLK